MIRLGVDTLCWHMRLEDGAVSLERVLAEARELGAECVQVNLYHARTRSLAELEALREAAGPMPLLASGDFLGAARDGDEVSRGVDRVRRWLERAAALGSPILRVASGFYRAELAGRPDLIGLEQAYVTDVLDRTADEARAHGITLLLENHSDFTAAEYEAIVATVGPERIGVFLDLTNAIAALEDPLPVVERLAPLARAGHVKDFVMRSIQQPDSYHRRGFEVLYRYPGEGVAQLRELVSALARGVAGRDYHLTVEGLDNNAETDDQRARLAPSLERLRLLIEEAA
jgi:sugar phosphate isomerase/epimerase